MLELFELVEKAGDLGLIHGPNKSQSKKKKIIKRFGLKYKPSNILITPHKNTKPINLFIFKNKE